MHNTRHNHEAHTQVTTSNNDKDANTYKQLALRGPRKHILIS